MNLDKMCRTHWLEGAWLDVLGGLHVLRLRLDGVQYEFHERLREDGGTELGEVLPFGVSEAVDVDSLRGLDPVVLFTRRRVILQHFRISNDRFLNVVEPENSIVIVTVGTHVSMVEASRADGESDQRPVHSFEATIAPNLYAIHMVETADPSNRDEEAQE